MSLPQDTTTRWTIDNRATYDGQPGLGCKPLALGAVVAECPTAFGGITIRDASTIGQPCPSKEELDAIGLRNAHMCKAAPDMLAALREWREAEAAIAEHEQTCPYWECGGCSVNCQRDRMDTAAAMRDAAIASAEGRE